MNNLYNLSQMADNEMKEFAMYTVANRAIPNMYDGMKPVQRFYLYSSIMNTPKDYKKVSAVSGVVSDYGYQHGESSAAGAGQLMAATWNNNICLVEGRGSFGTRQVQQSGAARYVYTRLHTNFSKYIKDIDLAPEHDDPEHTPPQFYLPVIPLVLANGTRGIATGFATNILPRALNDITAACKEYIKKGAIKNRLKVSFPDFTGTTEYDPVEERYICKGIYDKPTNTRLVINEIPYGFDRESYVKILDKLEDDSLIVGYEDKCSMDGFCFDIKLKISTSAKWNDSMILKKFKLVKPLSENLTVIDEDFKLREYNDERDLIKDFCDYRLKFLEKRISKNIATFEEAYRTLNIKQQFVKAVLDDVITFKGKSKALVSESIFKHTDAKDQADANALLRMQIMTLTEDLIGELDKEISSTKDELEYWNDTTPSVEFTKDLKAI